MNKRIIFLIFTFSILTSCKKQEVELSCQSKIDLNRKFQIKNGGSIELPKNSFIELTKDCKYIREFIVKYYWSNNKLVEIDNSSALNNSIIRIGARDIDNLYHHNYSIEKYRYEFGVAHEKYPLIYYGHWYVKDKINNNSDSVWGVLNTKNIISGFPQITYCDMQDKEDAQGNKIARNKIFMANFPDAKCRGRLIIVKDNVTLNVLIDVWAKEVPYIDQIYNAATEKIMSGINKE